MQNKVKGIKSYRVLKLYLFLGLFVFLTIGVMAQQATVNGVIKDSNGIVVPYASIEFYTQGETQELIDGTMSDESGSFSIENLPFGDYELVITAVGFSEFSHFLQINQNIHSLETLELSSDFIELAAVEIRGETSQYRTEIDKRVVDVGKDLVSAGADAAAVLNNIPSVNVDQQTGQLSLRGNENVKVMLDGKPTNIPAEQLLKQLPSNAISKVEIITNPSAKYDPEGNSGIINIITYKNQRKGYHLAVDLGLTQGRKTRHNTGLNANFNTGNFNFFGNYNGSFGKNRFEGNIDNYDSKLNQFIDNTYRSKVHIFKAGLDWFISDKSELTLYTNQYYHKGNSDADANVFDGNTNHLFLNSSIGRGIYKNQDYNLNFKQSFDKDDHNLVLDAVYATSNHDDRRYFDDTFPVAEYSEYRHGDKSSLRINLDYTNPISETGKIEAGLQYRYNDDDNNLLSDQEIEEGSIVFTPNINFGLKRDIYSAYLNYGQKFGKLSMQLGVRAEQVEDRVRFDVAPTTSGQFKNDYFELYPSVFFTYQLTEKDQLSLNYSRRVDRPRADQMSPVPEWTTSTMINKGNPDLKPQFTNSVELGYLKSIRGGSINAVVFYRRIEDNIFRTVDLNPENENIIVQKYVNYNSTESYGLELSANYRPIRWWSFNASFDAFSNELFYDTQRKQSFQWNARANNNFTINKQLSIQNFFMYRGKFEFIQGESMPMWRLDLGARYSFMNGKATLSARVTDIFKTFYSEVNLTNPVNGKGKFQWESQTVYVGFSFNIGGDVRKRNIIRESEQSAGGSGIGF